MSVPSDEFRTVMGHFPTGVTVVTALDGDQPQGITVNALASVSLDPPLLMVALDRTRFIVPTIERTRRYAVNILGEDQHALSDCFAGANVRPDRDAFCGASWRPGELGLPILDGSIASLECAVVELVDVGAPRLFVGRVEAHVEGAHSPPLLYHRRRYLRIERSTTARLVGKPESPAGRDNHASDGGDDPRE